MVASNEKQELLNFMMVKVTFMPDFTREGMLILLKQMQVEDNIANLLTSEELSLFYQQTQECQQGIRTSRGGQAL